MDDQRFDALTRTISRLVSRRSTLGGMAAGGLLSLVPFLGEQQAEAGLCRAPTEKCKRNKQCCSSRCRGGRCTCQKNGDLCQYAVFCCGGRCENGKCKGKGKRKRRKHRKRR